MWSMILNPMNVADFTIANTIYFITETFELWLDEYTLEYCYLLNNSIFIHSNLLECFTFVEMPICRLLLHTPPTATSFLQVFFGIQWYIFMTNVSLKYQQRHPLAHNSLKCYHIDEKIKTLSTNLYEWYIWNQCNISIIYVDHRINIMSEIIPILHTNTHTQLWWVYEWLFCIFPSVAGEWGSAAFKQYV